MNNSANEFKYTIKETPSEEKSEAQFKIKEKEASEVKEDHFE